jgi:photosystem II stability/assembly factor-like uncharacterized protein
MRRLQQLSILMLGLGLLAVLGQAAAPPKAAPPVTEDLLKALDFRSIGPTRPSGRFVDFAVPLQEPHTFYAATASGGLWKTDNEGQSFAPIFDHEKAFSIGDIAVAASDPRVVWVGTGEANNSRSTYWGDGLYKSTDAGRTWTNMGLAESQHIGRVVIHPADPNIVYVAALGHLYTENPERGVYKTTDGGRTWTLSSFRSPDGRPVGCVDLAMDPRDPDVLYAAAYDRLRQPWTYRLGGPGSGIWKTVDAGRTWAKLDKGLPGGMLGRIGLAVYAGNPDILYACIENANKPGMDDATRWREIVDGKPSRGMIDGQVYRSDDAGASWVKVSPDGRSIGGNPGYYYGQIIIDPRDDKHVYVLSVMVWETKDGGAKWSPMAFRFGGDNHALWIDPSDSNHMLLGFDHGMGITYDAGKTWYHPDNLPLAQFYAVGVDMSHPYNVAGGTQDNGSHLGPSTTRSGRPIQLEDWVTVGGGDGQYNVFDQTTNRYLYNEFQFGTLQRVDLWTRDARSIQYGKAELRWNWCSPVVVSSHDSNVIYHGSNVLLKSPYRGESWQEISPDLTTNNPAHLASGKGGDGNIQYCTITTIAESPLTRGLLWVGTDDGNLWLTRDDGAHWTKLNDQVPGNPGYWVSRVEASAFDPGTAYVSFTGFRRDDFRPFLYRTSDYGQTWTSITANLPRGPINVVREHPRNPNLLFCGTEFGVYVSVDGGQAWARMTSDLPTQPVHDMALQPREDELVVATHGRGIFIVDIAPLVEMTPAVLEEPVHLFGVKSRVKWVPEMEFHSSSSNYEGQSRPDGLIVYYSLRKAAHKVKLEVYQGDQLINELTGSSVPGLNKVLWNMTVRRERTPEEKKQIQERMKRYAEYSASFRGRFDPNYEYFPAGEGEYRLVLDVDGERLEGRGRILPDSWHAK